MGLKHACAAMLTGLLLLTQFRCGMHGTYHDYGTNWREVQARSFVTFRGDRLCNVTLAISNSRSSAWLVGVARFRESSASVGSFHPFKDYLDVQAQSGDEWHSWNVCLFPPRVWGYLGSDD